MYQIVETSEIIHHEENRAWIPSHTPVHLLLNQWCNVFINDSVAVQWMIWKGLGVPVQCCRQIERPKFNPLWIRNSQEGEIPHFIRHSDGEWSSVHPDPLAIIPERYKRMG